MWRQAVELLAPLGKASCGISRLRTKAPLWSRRGGDTNGMAGASPIQSCTVGGIPLGCAIRYRVSGGPAGCSFIGAPALALRAAIPGVNRPLPPRRKRAGKLEGLQMSRSIPWPDVNR